VGKYHVSGSGPCGCCGPGCECTPTCTDQRPAPCTGEGAFVFGSEILCQCCQTEVMCGTVTGQGPSPGDPAFGTCTPTANVLGEQMEFTRGSDPHECRWYVSGAGTLAGMLRNLTDTGPGYLQGRAFPGIPAFMWAFIGQIVGYFSAGPCFDGVAAYNNVNCSPRDPTVGGWFSIPDLTSSLNCGDYFDLHFNHPNAAFPGVEATIRIALALGPCAMMMMMAPAGGPGTELEAIFRELKARGMAGCGCKALARQMDAWGPAGCREHAPEIIARLNENWGKLRLRDKLSVGLRAVAGGLVFVVDPLDPAPGLLSEAIRRAESRPAP
jgi:hypothetical protein